MQYTRAADLAMCVAVARLLQCPGLTSVQRVRLSSGTEEDQLVKELPSDGLLALHVRAV